MRLKMWHGWLIGSITVVTAIILLGMSWFYSTADIRRVQAYAKAAGISTTWVEAAFPVPTAADQAAMGELARLAHQQSSLRTTDVRAAPRQIDPANAALRDHEAAIPATYWHELDAAIDSLPEVPGCLYERVMQRSTFEFLGGQRELVRMLAERIQCCPVEQIPLHVARAVRLCHPMRNQSEIQHLVDVACVAIVASAITSRRLEMTDPLLRHVVAESLRHVNDIMWDSRLDACRGETAQMFLLAADAREVARLSWSSPALGTWDGVRESLRYPIRHLMFRLNRECELRFLIDRNVILAAALDSHDLYLRMHAVPLPVPQFEWIADLAEIEPFVLGVENGSFLCEGIIHQQLVLSILLADLTDSPLPNDPFSATGAPLHPIERKGQVIGWYSVGPNGSDDGGKSSRDFGIPLRASFGKPQFSDEPESLPKKP